MILTIIIVNYNSKKVLYDCLNSIKDSGFNGKYEILVVDNNSSENIKDLENAFPWVNYYYNSSNLGFGAANNIGIKKSTGKIVLPFNSNTTINKNFFFSI